ncbi:MAG: site-2 protease family protein [Acidobacteria bacterium]|nr:site-2 protease family protein [Acidobacteriota bacterium]
MRIAGIRIVIDPTWLFVFALVVWSLATGYFPAADASITGAEAWTLGAVAGVLLFASVLVHELSHALLARRAGIPVPRIRLFLFGGVSEMAAEPHNPRSEFRIAVAGPLTSISLAALFWGLQRTALPSLVPGGPLVVEYLATINLALGIFNLVPGFPLDGGRILRAWLWWRRRDLLSATRTAGRAGSVVGYALMGLGLVSLIKGATLGGMWMILIGMFLNQAAGSSYQTALLKDLLSGVRVRERMTREVIAVPAHASLEELVNDYFYRHPHGSFPVSWGDGRLAGMVSLEQVKSVPRDDWVRMPVRQVMTPAEGVCALDPEEDCFAALEKMIRCDAGRLPVVDSGEIVGILSRRDVMKLFQVRSGLGA